MDDSVFHRPTYTTYSYDSPRKSKGKLRFIAIALILVGIILFGANMLLGSSDTDEGESIPMTPTPTEFVFPTDPPTPTPTAAPTATPSATPKATPPVDATSGLNRSTLTVEVQNGSGTVGAASKMADFLRKLGYKVVKIGNASSFDYEDITVQTTASKSAYLNVLKKDLSTSYTVGSTSAKLASSSAHAVVIIGE